MLTQQSLDQISNWTEENKMKLNKEKSKTMVFNFTNKFQFATSVSMENSTTEVISETKLLGVIINNKLDWDSNTQFLVKKGQR